jgi:hypothetical protein
LQEQFLSGLKTFQDTLLNKGLNERTLETLESLYRDRFIQVIEQCVSASQAMPYANRSNRKSDPISRRYSAAKDQLRITPRPDSGVDVDEGSEDGQLYVDLINGGVYQPPADTVSAPLAHTDSVKTVRHVGSHDRMTSYGQAQGLSRHDMDQSATPPDMVSSFVQQPLFGTPIPEQQVMAMNGPGPILGGDSNLWHHFYNYPLGGNTGIHETDANTGQTLNGHSAPNDYALWDPDLHVNSDLGLDFHNSDHTFRGF